MCGIAGIINTNASDITYGRLKNMTDIIRHRGPDGEGHWISENGHVGFGHRRLSILDLSELGSQPMHYLDRYTTVFNGEIYNYLEIKAELIKGGFIFHTTCDTEVLMAAYHKYGEKCLDYFDGMFSFVIYDKITNSIFAARDRFGEKPFFYSYEEGRSFIFGSEMKVLWAAGVEKSINPKMLYKYLTDGSIENPEDPSETFYNHCIRLAPSHYIKMDVAKVKIEIKRYFHIDYTYQDNQITEQKAKENFKELFYTSVSRRLRSDVPVGSSLSGGIDSSLIVCVIDDLIKDTGQKQKTFSAVFPGFAKDERSFMQKVIDQTNVEPHFVTPTDTGMIENLDKLCFFQEEPFGSASIYVQYCVMQLAKDNGVTVMLDGQGADEILGGYFPYFDAYHKELKNSRSLNYEIEIKQFKELMTFNHTLHKSNSGLAGTLHSFSPALLATVRKAYHFINNQNPNQLLTDDFKANGVQLPTNKKAFSSLNESLYYSTFKKGLHELLRYADRNSMAHSREIRLPFLSAELVSYIFSLPPQYKIRNAWTKWLMRESFSGLLPEAISWRKDKIGYEPPQKMWMENPLFTQKIRASQELLVKEGILRKDVLNQKVNAGGVGQTRNSSWSHFAAGNLFK